MNRKTLIGFAAAALAAVAVMGAAGPGNALACSGGLGEDCARVEIADSGAAMGALPSTAIVPPVTGPAAPEAGPLELAAGGCGAAAARAAAQGQVIGAPRVVKRGNQTLCVVTVLVKDPSGRKPPTRKQITVPAD